MIKEERMKKLSIVCLAVVMAVVFGFTAANADPSAKATAQIGDLSVVDVSGSNTTINIEGTPICVDGEGIEIPCTDNISGYEDDGTPICVDDEGEPTECMDTISCYAVNDTPICVNGDGDVIDCEDTISCYSAAVNGTPICVDDGEVIECTDNIIGYTNDTGWVTLFEQDIKTPTGKDLFINVSLECGLTTDTTVMSRALAKAVAEAEAVVEVRVLVGGDPVPVNGNDPPDTDITFARRNQKLIAEFAGDISGAMTVVDGAVVIDWDLVDPEMLQLILDTMQANSFNFVVPDLRADTHTVTVQAKLSYLATGNEVINAELDILAAEGKAAARAYLGNGAVTLEVVRMIKGEDVVVDLQ